MSRSSKKGPFIDPKLQKKVMMQKESGRKEPIKTWSRACVISPDFVGHTFMVHQGRKFLEVFVQRSNGRSSIRRVLSYSHLPWPR